MVYDKYNFKTQISPIFHFDRITDAWIRGLRHLKKAMSRKQFVISTFWRKNISVVSALKSAKIVKPSWNWNWRYHIKELNLNTTYYASGIEISNSRKVLHMPILIMNISFSLSYIQHRHGLVGRLGFFHSSSHLTYCGIYYIEHNWLKFFLKEHVPLS